MQKNVAIQVLNLTQVEISHKKDEDCTSTLVFADAIRVHFRHGIVAVSIVIFLVILFLLLLLPLYHVYCFLIQYCTFFLLFYCLLIVANINSTTITDSNSYSVANTSFHPFQANKTMRYLNFSQNQQLFRISGVLPFFDALKVPIHSLDYAVVCWIHV